ncbi:MAG TPA: phosphatase PAP2 family protein [Acidimicrobiales bacterium]|nr:phosphatase PAP2 family protein [Acidimicrobiales bacterium]
MLLPWSDAALIALVLALGSLAARRASSSRVARVGGPLAWETAIVLALYACWMKSADWAVTRDVGAAGHGLWVWHLERDLHLPSEVSVQRLLLPHPLWVQAVNGFYAVVHVPALIVFLLWLYFRHPAHYPRWRNIGAVLTGACLLIQMVPVAPPRLLPQLGFLDTALKYGQSVYGSGGLKIAPQLAAMPSVHVGWAVLIAVAVVMVSPSRWRWLVLAHPALTAFVVVATANHWWMDGIVAAALLPVSIAAVAGAALTVAWLSPRLAAARAVVAPPRPATSLRGSTDEDDRAPARVA